MSHYYILALLYLLLVVIALVSHFGSNSNEVMALGSELEDIILRLQEGLAEAHAKIKELRSANQTLQSARIEDDLCFVLMPFSESWSDDVWELLKSAAAKCNIRCERADEKDGRVVMDDVREGICRARVVIADLTSGNPNVMYEFGLADVLDKEVILLCQNPRDIPFDLLGLRLIVYENSLNGARKLSEQVEERLRKIKANS